MAEKSSRRDGGPMRIAPSYLGGHWTTEDWQAIDFATEAGWQKAIDILEDRIQGRFLKPVRAMGKREFSGFATMAIDCLLIETLQQFYEGVAETPPHQSRVYFRKFLTQTSFGESFDSSKANLFYDLIRCGILHQAEIKGNSRVWTKVGKRIVEPTPDGRGLLVNRMLFHEQLTSEFHDYISRLRKGDPPDHELRERFKCKMDAICGEIL